MQDVGGGVVALDGGTTVRIHASHNGIALGEPRLLGAHRVHEQALLGSLRVQHENASLAVLDDAGVPHFSAHLGIEGRGGQHHLAGLPRRQGAHALAIDDDGQHARLGGGGIVADELRGAELVQKIAVDAAVGGPGRLGVLRAGGAGALALGLHGGLEGLHVHFHAAAFRDLLGHFHGEAVSIVQGEGLLAGEHVALKLAEGLLQVGLALAQGGAEAVLLGHDEAALKLAVLHDLGVHISHESHDLVHVLVEEMPLDADELGLHDGAAQQAAQHVAAPLVTRQDAVGDHEGDRAGVIGDDAQGQVALGILAVGHAGQTLAHGHQAAQHVGLVVGLHALHDGGHALEPHARVDVLLRQRHQGAVLLAVVLGEHAVPVLEEPVAVAARRAVGAAAAELGALVVVDLRAGTAGAGGAGAPEVVVLAEARDVILGHAQVLPNLNGLVVVLEHGEVQALRRQPQHVHGEIVGPGAHLFFEVRAEGEVAEHLEEAQMTARGADDVDVVGAHALLHGGGADIGRLQLLLLQEVGLELHHAGARQKKRRIVGNERGGGHELAALLLEVVQVLLANLSGGHVTHRCSIRPLRSTKTVAADYSAPCALLFGRRRVIMGMARRHLPMGLRAQLRQLAAEQRRVVQLDGLHGAGGDAR